ncbi:hypothetical protein OMCYN_00590 [cyanobiont of Ornithocercus magnificus]|nr:hypothetical protein OMCYN_00590 [cyanobiont of Ornithocercus magnificus]
MLISLPAETPFRIDQVTAAPLLLGGLFTIQLLLAGLLSWIGAAGYRKYWWMVSFLWLIVTAVFFTLACWGTSDITKLNYYLAEDPIRYLPGEPFWWSFSSLILHLPYRMAAVHGLVVAGYATIGLLLAYQRSLVAWGSWWALSITTSPMLHGFLQNAHSRQALASLLALPLMLYLAKLAHVRLWLLILVSISSLFVHTTALLSLSFGALNALPWTQSVRHPISSSHKFWLSSLMIIVVVALLTAAALIVGPALLQKTEAYVRHNNFFSSYPIRRQVLQGQLVLLASLLWACWRRGLNWQVLAACPYSCRLVLNIVIYILLQLSVSWQVLPQIGFRLSDIQALFLLVNLLTWLQVHHMEVALVPLLIVNLIFWGSQVWMPEGLDCGQNDGFFCIPDRGPSAVQYS